MAQCGGLECMLNRLSGIKDFKQGRHLLTVSVLFIYFKTSNLFLNLAKPTQALCVKQV